MSDDRPIFPVPKPLPSVPQPKGLRKTERAKKNERDMAAWSADIRRQYGDRCEIGMDLGGIACRGPVQSAHVLGRGRMPRLRLDRENGCRLCEAHHQAYDRKGWFRPFFLQWFDARYPGRRARLEAKAIREARLS